ncbi:Carboxyvinyl-carboxyphosphonate phosphorylmutase [Bacillus sp. IT-79MI2]|nr:hypothetical protein BTH41_01011 [Bacillus mycoides]
MNTFQKTNDFTDIAKGRKTILKYMWGSCTIDSMSAATL